MRLSLPRKTMGAASNLGVRARDARSYGVLLSFLNEEECPGPAYQVAVLLLPYQHSLLTIISVVCSYSQSRSRIFRGGLRVGGSATHFSATHPYRNSRIGSGRHALAALLVQVCEGPQKGSSEKILQGTSGYRPAAGHDNSSTCFIVSSATLRSHGQPSKIAHPLGRNLGMSGIYRLLVGFLCQVVLSAVLEEDT